MVVLGTKAKPSEVDLWIDGSFWHIISPMGLLTSIVSALLKAIVRYDYLFRCGYVF